MGSAVFAPRLPRPAPRPSIARRRRLRSRDASCLDLRICRKMTGAAGLPGNCRDNAATADFIPAILLPPCPYRIAIQLLAEFGGDIGGQPASMHIEIGQEQVAADARDDR